MRLLVIAAVAVCGALAFVIGSSGDAPAQGNPDNPQSRADWPRERVVVVGQRGNVRDWLAGHTLIGTEGFADGSAPSDIESRSEFPWQVYYGFDGKVEAHFRKIGARVPHAAMEELDYVETGNWRVDDDGDVCQTIGKVGWGVEVCYYLERRGSRVAMYYTKCGAFSRCYPGRLGPEGQLVKGRAFTR